MKGILNLFQFFFALITTLVSSHAIQPVEIPPPTPVIQYVDFMATRYGDGRPRGDGTFEPNYNGQTMGCGGIYDSNNPAIVAVPYALNAAMPCGTPLRITSPYGSLMAFRTDTCPACGSNHIDLSESGLYILCGYTECGPLRGLTVEVLPK